MGDESLSAGEFLVILRPEAGAEALRELSAQLRVTHSVSPRVVVVATDAGTRPLSTSLAGVLAVVDDAVSPEIVKTLDDSEALFVDAWLQRRTDAPKQRSGDGLSWDAPGFAPPDPPADRSPAGH